LIRDCRLPGAGEQERRNVLIEDGVIAEIGGDEIVGGGGILEAEGRTLAPGFIDVHIQGAGGGDTLDGTVEGLEAISRTCAGYGVTGFLATTVYKVGQENGHIANAAKCVGRGLGGANLLGIHLEGPFIAGDRRGMIKPDCVCEPSEGVLDEIMETAGSGISMMTIAPELEGSEGLVKRLVKEGVVASFGHSGASYEQTKVGFEWGISHVTHCFNAMPGVHHRQPGPLVAIFESEDVTVQLICDGVHIHPAVLRIVLRVLGKERVVVITDGMGAMGMGDGGYIYSGLEYEVKDGACRYKDGTLIGTAVGMSELVKNVVGFTGWGPADVVRCASENPAKILGIWERKGSVEVGKDGDVVLLGEDLSVYATVVGGRVVWRSPALTS